MDKSGQGLPQGLSPVNNQQHRLKILPSFMHRQLLTTGTTPPHLFSPTPGPQGMTEVEGLDPQLLQRTVQMTERKKMRLGSEEGPQSRASCQKKKSQ